MTKRPSLTRTYVLLVIGFVSVVVAVLELGLPDPHLNIRNHHIQHVFIILGGGLFGLALAYAVASLRGPSDTVPRKAQAGANGSEPWQDARPWRGAWLLPALVAPLAVMFAMWPSTYEYIEAHALLHATEHGVFIVLAGITTFAGFQFARSTGWLLGAMVTVMAWAAAFGFGVAPGPSPLIAATATPPAAASTDSTASVDGAAVYQNCAACHQAQGTGIPGAFPPLAGHLPKLLAADGGREYVVNVMLYGLQGAISVEGTAFNGVMPAWAHLSDAELSAVVDYVSTSWGDAWPGGQAPLTAADFERARAQPLTSQEVHGLREKLGVP